MTGLRHSVRRQTFEVGTDSERLALTLRPRLERLNRRRLLPLIERVLDEVSQPGRRMRLGHLELDLGTLPADGFEREAERRLERELRRVLGEELQRAEREPRPDRRSLPERAYRQELLEHYLLRSTVPYWGPPPADFSFEGLVADILDRDPGDLVGTVRRLGRRTSVLERIVHQLSEPSLGRLIHLLEPEHGVLILAYLSDLRQVHRVERLVPLSDPEFARILWLLTQIYLVQDPGSQFNRRSFVRSLLRGLARGRGLDYRRLLETLERALERTRRRHSIRSSLPAVVSELVRELDRGAEREEERGPGAPRVEEPEDLGALLAALESGQTPQVGERMGERIRRLASRPQPGPAVVTRRLLEAVPPAKLFTALAPRHRSWLSELVQRLGAAEAAAGEVAGRLSEGVVREVVAQVLVYRGAAGWSSGELLRRILGQLAARAGVEDTWLTRELAASVAGASGAPATPSARKLARVLEEVRSRIETRPARPGETRTGDGVLQGVSRYEIVDRLRDYLRYGMLPWTDLLRSREPTPDRLLAGSVRLPRSLLRAVLVAAVPEEGPPTHRRLARVVPEDALVQLLLRLLPATAAPDSPFRSALAEFSTRARDRRQFLASALTTALRGEPFDLEALATAAGVPEEREPAIELGADLSRWPADVLQAALLSRLRFGTLEGMPEGTTEGSETGAERAAPRLLRLAPAAVRETPLPDLLSTLIEVHPEEAGELLRSLRERSHLWVALMRRIPVSSVDRLLEGLAPGEASALGALQAALVSIPIPHRPGPRERIAPVVLGEVLRGGNGAMWTEGFFARVLHELFGLEIPEEARRHLAREAGEWRTSSRLPVAHRETYATALEAAVAAVARPEDRETAAPGDRAAARPSAAAAERIARRDALFAFLRGEPLADHLRLAALSRSSIEHALRELAERSPEEMRLFLQRHLSSPALRERWARELSESTLARLTAVVEPRRSAALLDTVELLASAALEAGIAGVSKIADRAAVWSRVLEFLDRNAGGDRLVERWVDAFFLHAADRIAERPPESTAKGEVETAGARLLETAERHARTAGHARLRAILHRDRARLLGAFQPGGRERATAETEPESEPERPARRPQPPEERRRTAFGLDREEETAGGKGDPIYIDNAGLVLTGPFLPRLFGSLDFLDRDDEGRMRLRDKETASRAVHLLQFLVDGSTSAPEPLLVLNKLLCGVPTGAPVAKEIVLTEEERATCDKLLESMLANWPALSGTSVAGLQETFLQREGRLLRREDGWKLKVQRKTLDVLVDQIPWGISVVLQNWMPEPIYVEW